MPASLERTFFVCLNANPLFLNFEPRRRSSWGTRRGGRRQRRRGGQGAIYNYKGRDAPLLYRPSTDEAVLGEDGRPSRALTLTLTLIITLTL